MTYDAASRTLESFGASRARAMGHAVRQRRPRVHVRRGTALGHAQRGGSRRRQRAGSAGIRWFGAPRDSSRAIRWGCDAVGVGRSRAWCVAVRRLLRSLRRRRRRLDNGAPRHRQAHEYPASLAAAPQRPDRTGSRRPGRRPSRAFADAYINWDADTSPADMRALAAASVGQARSAMELAAARRCARLRAQARRNRQQRHGRGGRAAAREQATSTWSSRASRPPPPIPPPTRDSGRRGTSTVATVTAARSGRAGWSAAGSPRAERETTVSATAPSEAEQRRSAEREPCSVAGPPVTIPTIASIMHATAMRARIAASTRIDSPYPGLSGPRRKPHHAHRVRSRYATGAASSSVIRQ